MTTPPMNIELRKRLREIEEEIVSRAPEHDIDPTLVRVANLLEVMGDPQRAYPVIHITGTNGKTSTARMIERLLSELNLRTGRFTSPHLHDIRERIVLSGEPVSPERLIEAYDDLAPLLALVEERSLEAATGRLSLHWPMRSSRTPPSTSPSSRWGSGAPGTQRMSRTEPSRS